MPCALLACRAVVVAVEFRAIAGFALVERGGPGGASLSAILVVDRFTVVADRWLGRNRLRSGRVLHRGRTGTRVDARGVRWLVFLYRHRKGGRVRDGNSACAVG